MISNGKFNFRPMRDDDLDSVLIIDHLSFSIPWPKSAYLHDLQKNQNAILWVAEDVSESPNRKVIAMIDVWMILKDAHIATLAVHPDYRGQGIASNLLELLLLEVYRRGATRVMLEVRESNLKAQSIYREFGFEVVHRRRRYYRDNQEDALLMNLEDLESEIKTNQRYKTLLANQRSKAISGN